MSRRRPPALEDAAPAVILAMPEAEAPDLAAPVDGARPELEDVLEDGAPEDEADEDEDGAEVIDLAARRPPAGAPEGADDEDGAEGEGAEGEAEDAPGAPRVPDAAEVARLMREWGIDPWRAKRALDLIESEVNPAGHGCPERIAVLPRVRRPTPKAPTWGAMTTPDNLRAVFELRPWRERLRWDAFALRAELRGAHPAAPWAPWEDAHTPELRADLSADLGAVWPAEDVRAYAQGAARLTEWHPVRAYLSGLRWDGVKRAESWLTRFYGAPDTRLSAEMGERWLISAVARVMDPGCKADCVLTLAGAQGAAKSRSLRALAGPWFADSPLPIGDKDGAQNLRGRWIWELAELSDVQGKTFEAVKAYLSSAEDTYRPSYGRESVTIPRQTVFCATVNPETGQRFLADRTGNRRFWVVTVARTVAAPVDVAALEAERDQLWAEALAMFEADQPWHLPPDLEAALAEVQENAQGEIDPWASLVNVWLDTEAAPPFFTTATAAKAAVGLEDARLDQRAARRVGGCLKHAGATSAVRRIGGVQVKGWAWARPEDTAADEGAP